MIPGKYEIADLCDSNRKQWKKKFPTAKKASADSPLFYSPMDSG
jgi:hypothetical protein